MNDKLTLSILVVRWFRRLVKIMHPERFDALPPSQNVTDFWPCVSDLFPALEPLANVLIAFEAGKTQTVSDRRVGDDPRWPHTIPDILTAINAAQVRDVVDEAALEQNVFGVLDNVVFETPENPAMASYQFRTHIDEDYIRYAFGGFFPGDWVQWGIAAYEALWEPALSELYDRANTYVWIDDYAFVWTTSTNPRFTQVARWYYGRQQRRLRVVVVFNDKMANHLVVLYDGGFEGLSSWASSRTLPNDVDGYLDLHHQIKQCIRNETQANVDLGDEPPSNPHPRRTDKPAPTTKSGAPVDAKTGLLAHNPFAGLRNLLTQRSE